MEVEGISPGKDFVLYPGGGHAWDWAVHGTRHAPGIQPGDVRELLGRGVGAVVLGLGGRLLRVRLRLRGVVRVTVSERGPWGRGGNGAGRGDVFRDAGPGRTTLAGPVTAATPGGSPAGGSRGRGRGRSTRPRAS